MASISGINTKWWSNELYSNWAIELSGFAQSNWSPTTGEEDKNLPNTCWADSWIERTREVDILGSQAGKQGEGGAAQRSDGAWRIWARFCEESEHAAISPNLASHTSRGMRIAESTCSARPLSACQNQNVQNFVLSQNPNISMNFSGQRHCLASGMCKICAINIFRNI